LIESTFRAVFPCFSTFLFFELAAALDMLSSRLISLLFCSFGLLKIFKTETFSLSLPESDDPTPLSSTLFDVK
jgi:4'-phosphopantetheinyl transferase EntD